MTVLFVKVMNQSIPKLPMPPPSLLAPWAFEFFEKFWWNCPVCWQFRWSNAHWLGLQKASNPPPTSKCSKISQCINSFIQMYTLLYKSEISQSLRKLSYGSLFIYTKLYIPESPHLQAFSNVLKDPTKQRI